MAFATVTPSFVIFGLPQLCSRITLRPCGAKGQERYSYCVNPNPSSAPGSRCGPAGQRGRNVTVTVSTLTPALLQDHAAALRDRVTVTTLTLTPALLQDHAAALRDRVTVTTLTLTPALLQDHATPLRDSYRDNPNPNPSSAPGSRYGPAGQLP